MSVTTHECWSDAETCTALPPQFSGNIAATSLGPRGVLVSLGSRPATKVSRVPSYQSNLKHRKHVVYFAVTTQNSSTIRAQRIRKVTTRSLQAHCAVLFLPVLPIQHSTALPGFEFEQQQLTVPLCSLRTHCETPQKQRNLRSLLLHTADKT